MRHSLLTNLQLSAITSLLLFLLSACAENNNAPSAARSPTPTENQQKSLTPELSSIYQSTCAHCHTQTSTGAPQTGDIAAWRKVLAKGIDATLERAIVGSGGMPPAGQCFTCSPEDMLTLINFMSSPQETK